MWYTTAQWCNIQCDLNVSFDTQLTFCNLLKKYVVIKTFGMGLQNFINKSWKNYVKELHADTIGRYDNQ